jgi:hypothetical protein
MPQNKNDFLANREEISRTVLDITDCTNELLRYKELLELAMDQFPPEHTRALKRVSLLLEVFSDRNSARLAALAKNVERVRALLGHPGCDC